MFVYVVQNPGSGKREAILKAAEKCCQIEKMLAGENNRMAQRYAAALEVQVISLFCSLDSFDSILT